MKWTTPISTSPQWSGEISNYDEKLVIAQRLVANLKDNQVIGVGSGSTAYLTLQEIAKHVQKQQWTCLFIPTSKELQMACGQLGLQTATLLDCKPDWYFDGADKVDPGNNLIKGRGGAMYREKLIMRCAKKSYILVDTSKFVENLDGAFPIPVEVAQEALHYAEQSLIDLGASEVVLRPAGGKDGPVITESGNFILDADFKNISATLEADIKKITGVVESGLFWGYEPEILTN